MERYLYDNVCEMLREYARRLKVTGDTTAERKVLGTLQRLSGLSEPEAKVQTLEGATAAREPWSIKALHEPLPFSDDGMVNVKLVFHRTTTYTSTAETTVPLHKDVLFTLREKPEAFRAWALYTVAPTIRENQWTPGKSNTDIELIVSGWG